MSSDDNGREQKVRVAALVPLTLVVLLIFVLLASLVSWPWHNQSWTRADFDLASQRHPGDTATQRFCVAMIQLESESNTALRALRSDDVDGLKQSLDSIATAFSDARSAADGLPHVQNVASLRKPLDGITAARQQITDERPAFEPLTSQLVHMSLAAKLEGARAGCPTFSVT